MESGGPSGKVEKKEPRKDRERKWVNKRRGWWGQEPRGHLRFPGVPAGVPRVNSDRPPGTPRVT